MFLRVLLLGFAVFSFIPPATANAAGGTVCLGENLSRPPEDRTRRLHLTIDNSAALYFDEQYTGPKTVAQGLDVRKRHVVKIYFDDQVVKSFTFDFRQHKSRRVLLWRAPGSWKITPHDTLPCRAMD